MMMTDDREKIKSRFEQFVIAVQDNRPFNMREILAHDVLFETQPMGIFRGADEVVRRFIWRGPSLDISRHQIFNHSLHIKKDTASQTGYVVALAGHKVNGYLHHFQYGGHFVNKWRREGGEWQLEQMKYQQDMEFGNTSFTAGWWKMIDYTIYGGYEFHPIDAGRDTPWRNYSEDELPVKEQIADVYNRYAWGIDENDFEITASALTEDVYANIPGAPLHGRKPVLDMLKGKRDKENTMSHVGKIAGMDLDEKNGSASLYVWRYEPHRIGTRILHAGNVNTQFYSVKYVFHIIRAAEGWKTRQIDYDIGVFGHPADDRVYQ